MTRVGTGVSFRVGCCLPTEPIAFLVLSFARKNMLTERLLADATLDESPARDFLSPNPHDSSRLLLGLMTLHKRADLTGQSSAPESLAGIISKGVLRSLMSALHFRDAATVRHSRRVAQLATGIAKHLGWESQQITLLEVAALLHDVGKIGVPDNILFKPGRLSPDEAELMDLHHNIGVDVLQACRVNKEVVKFIVQAAHHYHGYIGRTRPAGANFCQGGGFWRLPTRMTHSRPIRPTATRSRTPTSWRFSRRPRGRSSTGTSYGRSSDGSKTKGSPSPTRSTTPVRPSAPRRFRGPRTRKRPVRWGISSRTCTSWKACTTASTSSMPTCGL